MHFINYKYFCLYVPAISVIKWKFNLQQTILFSIQTSQVQTKHCKTLICKNFLNLITGYQGLYLFTNGTPCCSRNHHTPCEVWTL